MEIFDDDDEPNEPVPAIIAQVDGTDAPASLTPTPETSPEQEIIKVTGTRPKVGVRLGPADYLPEESSDSDFPTVADCCSPL